MLACLQCSAWAQSYNVTWSSINSSGGVMSGAAYKVNGSVGQAAAGTSKSVNLFHWIGFWSGDVPNPIPVSSIKAAKCMADGTFVSIAGQIASTSSEDFGNRFWIQDPNRANGIMVLAPAGVLDGLARGSIVNVIGTLGTAPNGVRCFTGPVVFITSSTTPPNPLGMPGKSIGGADFGISPLGQIGPDSGVGLNNIGLLVRTWSKVIPGDAGFLTIDDGSGTPIRIPERALAHSYNVGDFVTLIGISDLDNNSGSYQRLVIPRNAEDMVP
ncbi:MAG: hypothetical protein ABFD54_03770 [Armatimonadota bacterium]